MILIKIPLSERSTMSVEYISSGFELPIGVSPSFARWTMLNRMAVPLLPEYAEVASPEVLRDEKEISRNYTFVSRRLHPRAALVKSSDMSLDTRRKARDFFSFNSNRDDEFEYIDERTFQGETRTVESFKLKFSFGGYHWYNPINLLVTMSNSTSTYSQEFKDIAEQISQKRINLETVQRLGKMMDLETLQKSLKSIFVAMMKNQQSLYYRVMIDYQTDLFDEWGYLELFDLKEYSDILYPKDLSPDLEDSLRSIVTDLLAKIDTAAREKEHKAIIGKAMPPKSVPWNTDLQTLKPNTDLSPLNDNEVDLHQEYGSEISVFKVVLDISDTDDESRMNFSEYPYPGDIPYDPKIKRGVTREQQPYKVVVANSKANISEVQHDNHILRKMVACDMMTRALDWAALKGLPLPPLGSEVFAHMADSTDSAKLIESKLPLIVNSRQRRHRFLAPFPDYSYGVFTHHSRFDIKEDPVATWDSVKDYILTSTQASVPLNRRQNDVFFKGAHYSHVYIREHLELASKKPIMASKKILIPQGSLIMDIPPTRGVLNFSSKPITIPEMAEHRFLLDLPGYGMWSTRLKFICLTGSIVIRIMFVDIEYLFDPVTGEGRWECMDSSKIWETFFDTFVPFDIVETIIGNHYIKNKYISDRETESLNRDSRNRVTTVIGKIYEQYNKNPQKAKEVVKNTVDTVSRLTNDKISEYIYWLMMRMAEIYGHLRPSTLSFVTDAEIRDRCPPRLD